MVSAINKDLAVGFHGKKSEFNSDMVSTNYKNWLMDSAASNHMTNSENGLCNVQKYMGNQHIQVANGDNLPISSIGDLGSNFKDIFVSPKLSANLLSVGQMVENNCEIDLIIMVVMCRIKCREGDRKGA